MAWMLALVVAGVTSADPSSSFDLEGPVAEASARGRAFATLGQVPFADLQGEGRGAATLEAQQRLDVPGATYGDLADFQASVQLGSQRVEIELIEAGLPPGLRDDVAVQAPMPIEGGVALHQRLYTSQAGLSGYVTPVDAAISVWGVGRVTLDGRVLTERALVHVTALSAGARSDDGRFQQLPEARAGDLELGVLALGVPELGFVQLGFDEGVRIVVDGRPVPKTPAPLLEDAVPYRSLDASAQAAQNRAQGTPDPGATSLRSGAVPPNALERPLVDADTLATEPLPVSDPLSPLARGAQVVEISSTRDAEDGTADGVAGAGGEEPRGTAPSEGPSGAPGTGGSGDDGDPLARPDADDAARTDADADEDNAARTRTDADAEVARRRADADAAARARDDADVDDAARPGTDADAARRRADADADDPARRRADADRDDEAAQMGADADGVAARARVNDGVPQRGEATSRTLPGIPGGASDGTVPADNARGGSGTAALEETGTVGEGRAPEGSGRVVGIAPANAEVEGDDTQVEVPDDGIAPANVTPDEASVRVMQRGIAPANAGTPETAGVRVLRGGATPGSVAAGSPGIAPLQQGIAPLGASGGTAPERIEINDGTTRSSVTFGPGTGGASTFGPGAGGASTFGPRLSGPDSTSTSTAASTSDEEAATGDGSGVTEARARPLTGTGLLPGIAPMNAAPARALPRGIQPLNAQPAAPAR